jgi:hypothetical protein
MVYAKRTSVRAKPQIALAYERGEMSLLPAEQ